MSDRRERLADVLTSNTRFRADILAGNPPKALLVDDLLAKWHAYAHDLELYEARYWSTAQDAVCHDHERLARDWRANE